MRKSRVLSIFIVLFLLSVNAGAQMKQEKAIFAGGCFWCVESAFDDLEGVISAVSGYTDGQGADPTYEDYAHKGYVEAVEITYNPSKITYEQLLDIFWRQIDPMDAGGQFVDRGKYYRSAIFYLNESQKEAAEKSKKALNESGRFDMPIVTEILPSSKFYPAEEYHQDYHKKSKVKYKYYRYRSGRDQFLEKVWKKNTDKSMEKKDNNLNREVLKKKLTPLQYKVTQENGTEPAFNNEYWDNKKDGIYVDIISGEALFSSVDKYESGTGWPSFIKPLEKENIVEKEDNGFFMKRIEIRSKKGDAHLGHVFDDGPVPTGLRYCMNSAALRFIPKEEMKKEGYGKYLYLFEK